MTLRPIIPILAGCAVVVAMGYAGAQWRGEALVGKLAGAASNAIQDTGGQGVRARFATDWGWPTRHPTLLGGKQFDPAKRTQIATAVYNAPGVGGVRWQDRTGTAAAEEPLSPSHCQDDVEALLQARSIRFEESSASIDPASRPLVDEVAAALRPCLGSIIAITGHTDSSGPEPGNLALSRQRAAAVQRALIRRGIPADGLRARGVGSRQPVEGLDPGDPANRRIEFSVVETVAIEPTPIDLPGAN